MNFPLRLNMGCGQDFKDDYLNLDYDQTWEPDIQFDLNKPLFEGPFPEFITKRFGLIRLEPGTFELIRAYDVLEHLPNLVTAMTSCLQLLRFGGKMDIYVPYDLSWGAWQDPTHVRAFNENSWLYYTDWFWRLGWREARFAMGPYAAILSEVGQEQQARGLTLPEIARMPRAVSHMRVVLEKVPLSAEDLAQYDNARKTRAGD